MLLVVVGRMCVGVGCGCVRTPHHVPAFARLRSSEPTPCCYFCRQVLLTNAYHSSSDFEGEGTHTKSTVEGCLCAINTLGVIMCVRVGGEGGGAA